MELSWCLRNGNKGTVSRGDAEATAQELPSTSRQRRGIFPRIENRRFPLRTIALTIILLTISNLFMTFAWYAHLRNLSSRPWYIAAAISWGIAFFEYMVQVPANRIGFGRLSLAQLKVIQEVVTLCVFVPFAVLYMKQSINLNFLWAGLCLIGAVFFMFR
jgi:uncharacterized protein (DUF486 family)